MNAPASGDESDFPPEPTRPGPFLVARHFTSGVTATWVAPTLLTLGFLIATDRSIAAAVALGAFILALLVGRAGFWGRAWFRYHDEHVRWTRRLMAEMAEVNWDQLGKARDRIEALEAEAKELRETGDERWADTKKISAEKAAGTLARLLAERTATSDQPSFAAQSGLHRQGTDSAMPIVPQPAPAATQIAATTAARVSARRVKVREGVASGRPGAQHRPGGPRPGDGVSRRAVTAKDNESLDPELTRVMVDAAWSRLYPDAGPFPRASGTNADSAK